MIFMPSHSVKAKVLTRFDLQPYPKHSFCFVECWIRPSKYPQENPNMLKLYCKVPIIRVLGKSRCISVSVYVLIYTHKCGTDFVLLGVKGGIPANEIYV